MLLMFIYITAKLTVKKAACKGCLILYKEDLITT
jgi:hypothetical protein